MPPDPLKERASAHCTAPYMLPYLCPSNYPILATPLGQKSHSQSIALVKCIQIGCPLHPVKLWTNYITPRKGMLLWPEVCCFRLHGWTIEMYGDALKEYSLEHCIAPRDRYVIINNHRSIFVSNVQLKQHTFAWSKCPSWVSDLARALLQKQISCVKYRVVTLVADYLERWWLWD